MHTIPDHVLVLICQRLDDNGLEALTLTSKTLAHAVKDCWRQRASSMDWQKRVRDDFSEKPWLHASACKQLSYVSESYRQLNAKAESMNVVPSRSAVTTDLERYDRAIQGNIPQWRRWNIATASAIFGVLLLGSGFIGATIAHAVVTTSLSAMGCVSGAVLSVQCSLRTLSIRLLSPSALRQERRKRSEWLDHLTRLERFSEAHHLVPVRQFN